jgi:hypothetical protein
MSGVRLNRLPAMRAILVMALLTSFPPAVLASDIVAGVVRNQTRGQPAAGDEVILIRFDGGMQAEARTKTDQQGVFTLSLLHPEKYHLLTRHAWMPARWIVFILRRTKQTSRARL